MQNATLVERLQPESDTKIFRSVAIAVVVSLVFSYYLSQIQFAIGKIFFEEPPTKLNATVNLTLPPKKVDPPKIKPTPQQQSSKQTTTKNTGSSNSNPKPTRGNPKAIQAQSMLAILAARSKAQNLSAYNFINKQMHNDIDKTLKSNARLVTQGGTKFGDRRGVVNGTWDGGGTEGGSDGIGDAISNLLKPGTMGGTRTIGSVVKVKPSEINMPSGSVSRSSQEIMQVVKSRTPGLRHIFNRTLKTVPGMAGKVTLKFTILPGGEVVECSIVSSTTNNEEFDEAIRKQVMTWEFKVIPSGNTTVSLPFTFSE